MHWFLDPIKHQYADFTGRTARKAFWMYVLWYVLIYVAISVVAWVLDLEALVLLFALAIIVPSFAISARRLHDTGLSGWWQLLGFIPFLGLIIMIVLMARPSQAGANQYGPVPDAAGAPAAESAPDTEPALETPEEPENTQHGFGQ